MNKFLTLCIAALTATAAFAADALPAFNATLTSGKESRFVLIGADGKASSWLQVGDVFDGYTIKGYDSKTAVLDLEKDGKVSHLSLAADAKISAGALASAPGTLEQAETVLNKLHFDELITQAMTRQQSMINARFDQVLSRMKASGISEEDANAYRARVMEEMKTILDPAQLKDDMKKIYTEVFTKDELDGMSAFYSTPLGETIATKQADVQEKVGTLVQQRMMTAMPKLAQLQQDFVAQQRAKKQAAAPAPAAATPAPTPAASAAPTPAAPAPRP